MNMPSIIEGRALHVGEEACWERVSQLISVDLEEALGDDAMAILGYCSRGLILGGDVHVEGDVSSADLPTVFPGFEGEGDGRYFVVVTGDLRVSGSLRIRQYNDLFVAGDVVASSIHACSANAVVKGPVSARDIVCLEDSDEGGVFFAERFITPLLVRIGCNHDVAPDVSGLEATSVHHAKVLAEACGQKPRTDLGLYELITDYIISGEAASFASRYLKLAGSSS